MTKSLAMNQTSRQTRISKSLLDLLKNDRTPKTVVQILGTLKTKGISPNKTTIYRQIQKLIDQNMVSEITLKNGIAFYEYRSEESHCHFFCLKCESVQCLPGCGTTLDQLKSEFDQKQLSIMAHDFNLYGTCEYCGE